MIDTIEFKGQVYPKFQSEGFAARFAFPFAEQVCKGRGYDIGCSKLEWSFPGSIPIDMSLPGGYHAMHLPYTCMNYIFSSHCLEHISNWVEVLDYWYENLIDGGTLFLYLPHPSQEYWLPHNNRKHVNIFHPQDLKKYFIDKGFKKVFVSDVDLNNSFMIMGEK